MWSWRVTTGRTRSTLVVDSNTDELSFPNLRPQAAGFRATTNPKQPLRFFFFLPPPYTFLNTVTSLPLCLTGAHGKDRVNSGAVCKQSPNNKKGDTPMGPIVSSDGKFTTTKSMEQYRLWHDDRKQGVGRKDGPPPCGRWSGAATARIMLQRRA